MTQTMADIVTTESGTTLASDMTSGWKPSILSSHAGTSRPSYAVRGTLWIDNDTPTAALNYVYLYDGTNDVLVGYFDTTNHIFIANAAAYPNSQSAAYTTVLQDAGKLLLHPTADNTARTFTIDSNANVAYQLGTRLEFYNQINTLTIAITSDTLTESPGGTTGSVLLGPGERATAVKVSTTGWVITRASQRARAVNSNSAAYTTVLGDMAKFILHPTADNNPRTFTIDSNANVAYPIGAELVFVNQINTLTIAITSDTLTLEPDNSTGSITIGAGGEARALKVSSTGWVIRKAASASGTMAALTDIAAQTVTQAPNVDNAIDLGTTSKSWRVIYATALAIKNQLLQNFTLEIQNVAGTLKSSFAAQAGSSGTAGNFEGQVSGATITLTTIPTGTDSSTAFAGGGKIGTGNTQSYILNTASQTIADQIGTLVMEYNDTATANLMVYALPLSVNVNGVTRNYLHFRFFTSAMADFTLNTTNIASGKTIRAHYLGFIG